MRSAQTKAGTPVSGKAASARPADRLLGAATQLFGRYGIRAVGVDRILREADCAKASLYSAFGSKDALVIAYLTQLDLADRQRFAQATRSVVDPVTKALTFFDLAHAKGLSHDFPGCLYTSAASEFPGVRFEPIDNHRHWVRSTISALIESAGVQQPAPLARQIQLLYDGALVASKVEQSAEPIRYGRDLAEQAVTQALGTRA